MKRAIITGASGGMGYQTATLLAKNGYTVFALDKNACERVDNVIPIQVDVTNVESVKSAYEQVLNYTDTVDVIIHFAGVYMLDSLIEISDQDFQKIFSINLFGAFYVNKIFMPLLKKGSKILMTTSELAPLDPLPFTGIYAISKSALDKYAYSLKMELQLLGINISVLRAGAVSTGMLGVSTDALEKFCKKTTNYECNAKKFKKIVDSVESKSLPPIRIAQKVYKIIKKKKPKFAYKINRNKLLLLLNALPNAWQFGIIKNILKNPKNK